MAKNRGFSKLDPQGHIGDTTTWLTPLDFVHKLGKFDLDPCGFAGHWTAKHLLFPGAQVSCDDGLKYKWYGRVWLNPPYGRGMDEWLTKLADHGNGIALVFARTDTNLFHDINPDLTFFLKGRIKFLSPFKRDDKGKIILHPRTEKPILLKVPEESTNAGHGSMLLAWGQRNVKAILKSGIEGKGF